MFRLHKKYHKYNNQSGFTVIEAVVSAGVFAFVVSSILGVYLATTQLDSKTRAERAVQQNARFIMDFLGKEIRNGTIDYSKINDIDSLNLINQLDETELIQWDGASNITLTKAAGTTNLNSDGVRVTRLNFYLSPTIDPFVLANAVNIQPHVTVVMRLVSNYTSDNTEQSSMDLQTTFTVRDYPSRQ